MQNVKAIHLIGIGGINMSAVAKLLLNAGVHVSGSDLNRNDQIAQLESRGARVSIGHDPAAIPSDVELIVYSSAVPESNSERVAGRERALREMTNFEFLGEWFANTKTVVVCGTHGKSTTTAMLGVIAEAGALDPVVIVGSKVPQFPDGNLRLGTPNSGLCIIEGDEYAKHFLAFRPYAVVLNNIELDHTDVFPNIASLVQTFREFILSITHGGILVANVGDERVRALLEQEKIALQTLQIRVIPFNADAEGVWRVSHQFDAGESHVTLEKSGMTLRYELRVPGAFNAMNAAGAALLAQELGVAYPTIAKALASFTGIWRRMELLRDKDDIRVYSDYGHHPTAVAATLHAAKELSMNSRVILCFQPHHRNRTKRLFLDFVTSFDLADALILCEIYDVAGRDATADEDVSSADLVDAVTRHDADRGASRLVEYAADPTSAVARTLALAEPGDVVIVMGAGDIDSVIRAAL